MPSLLPTIDLVGLVLGASYLYLKHRQRVRNGVPRHDSPEWTGHGIEISGTKPRVDQVRLDYLRGRLPRRQTRFHRALLEMARRAVSQLSYFREREAKGAKEIPPEYGA